MTMLNSKRVAETLDKLHADADAADRDLMAKMMGQLETSGETLKDMAARFVDEERVNYRATYRGHADHFLAISPAYGRFLYAIARARRATRIVEFGTSMGVSTIYLAAALYDNGGGKLIGSELEPTKVTRARAHLEAAGLAIWWRSARAMRSIRLRTSAARLMFYRSMARFRCTCRC